MVGVRASVAGIRGVGHISASADLVKGWSRGHFAGGPEAKTELPQQRARVRFMGRELDPTGYN